jgi:hypothetical protein
MVGDPMAGAVLGTLLPDTMRSIVVISATGALGVAIRDAMDPAVALVRDVRPAEAGAGVAACRPWPWMLIGEGPAVAPEVLDTLRRQPVIVLWAGGPPAGLPAHARAFSRFPELARAARAAGAASVAGLRMAPGLGVVSTRGAYVWSAPLQALVSSHPHGFALPRHRFRGAADALARLGSPWRPALTGDGRRVVLAVPSGIALAPAS